MTSSLLLLSIIAVTMATQLGSPQARIVIHVPSSMVLSNSSIFFNERYQGRLIVSSDWKGDVKVFKQFGKKIIFPKVSKCSRCTCVARKRTHDLVIRNGQLRRYGGPSWEGANIQSFVIVMASCVLPPGCPIMPSDSRWPPYRRSGLMWANDSLKSRPNIAILQATLQMYLYLR